MKDLRNHAGMKGMSRPGGKISNFSTPRPSGSVMGPGRLKSADSMPSNLKPDMDGDLSVNGMESLTPNLPKLDTTFQEKGLRGLRGRKGKH